MKNYMKNTIVFVLFVILLCNVNLTKANAFQIIYEEECYEGEYTTGPVSFVPVVDQLFCEYDYLIVDLIHKEDDYVVEEVLVDFHDCYKYDTVLPVGTYTLMDVRFEESTINTNYSISPTEFVVTENGVEGVEDNIIWINVNYEQYVPVPIKNKFIINEGKGFEGFANITVYNKTDTVYQDNPQKQRIQITHISANQTSSVKANINAGDICISDVNVYDANKKPLHVYYNPNYVKLQRSNAYVDEYVMKHQIYIFSDESELSSDILEKVKNPENGYILKTAAEMNPYEERKDETFDYLEKNTALGTIYKGDIPTAEQNFTQEIIEVEQNSENLTETEEIKELKKVESKENNNRRSSIVTVIIIVFMVLFIVMAIMYCLKKRK